MVNISTRCCIAGGGPAGMMLGLAALAYQGFTYTTRETVIDIGPIQATAERKKTVPLPPVAALALRLRLPPRRPRDNVAAHVAGRDADGAAQPEHQVRPDRSRIIGGECS